MRNGRQTLVENQYPLNHLIWGHKIFTKEQIPYIMNFLRRFNFLQVCELPEIAKYRHSKRKPNYKSSLRVLEIAKIGLSENLTVTSPSKRHIRQNSELRNQN